MNRGVPHSNAPKTVDMRRVLDRIAAALAALDQREAPKALARSEREASPEAPERRVKLRHNWG
jgi:hypothetical protein